MTKECSPDFINLMVKKSRSINKSANALVALDFIKLFGYLNWGFAGFLAALTFVSLWNPGEDSRNARKLLQLQTRRESDLRRIDRESKLTTAAGVLEMTFGRLNFLLPPEVYKSLDPNNGYGQWLPEGIKAYDGREIRIRGYMLPTKLEKGQVRECLILANQMACCYGQSPRFCEFIVASATGKPIASEYDRIITFQGNLHVRDVFEDGCWTALYTMDCVSAER